MSKQFESLEQVNKICRRRNSDLNNIKNNFAYDTLCYLDERIINHLLDSSLLDGRFNRE